MFRQGVNEFPVVEQPADFLADVAAEFARGIRDLLHNRGTTVKDSYDVFEVTAGVEVAFPSSAECLQFCPDEIRSGYDPQLKPVDRDYGGSFNCRLVPAVREPKDGLVCRHDVKFHVVDQPSADWCTLR